MDKKEIKRIADIIYNTRILEGWKNVNLRQCELKAIEYLDTQAILNRWTN
tara:strand:- start:3060 stop:3209 length:150 start_codon:yes stop_codon:yes gene_type:complete